MPINYKRITDILHQKPAFDFVELKNAIIENWNNELSPDEQENILNSYLDVFFGFGTAAGWSSAKSYSVFLDLIINAGKPPVLPKQFIECEERGNTFRSYVDEISRMYNDNCPKMDLDRIQQALSIPQIFNRELAISLEMRDQQGHEKWRSWALSLASPEVAIKYLTFDKTLYMRAVELHEPILENPLVAEALRICEEKNEWKQNTFDGPRGGKTSRILA